MTKQLQEKILELRKELRQDYERMGNNLFLAMQEVDVFLERLYNGLKGGEEK